MSKSRNGVVRDHVLPALGIGVSVLTLIGPARAQTSASVPPANATLAAGAKAKAAAVAEVVVTASRQNLLGVAQTASQGSVTRQELELRPAYRVGQLLESVPGLVVTIHSGEGKANQYLLRGFNLDHGTDIGIFVDNMPVNRPSNAHGQGYSDLNFIIPQLGAGADYTKGPYYPAQGDFSAVASVHLRLLDVLPNQLQVSAGTLGDRNIFLGGSHPFGDQDRLLAAIRYGQLDGPWTPSNNFHSLNGALRYSHGTTANGFSLTGLYYHSEGRLTTDQPVEAFRQGLIGRYGTLDPTDGSRSERYSLSANYASQGADWRFSASAYAIHSRMTLWNDFTHYLDDPVNGDQEAQDEDRTTGGGAAAYTLDLPLGPLRTSTTLGFQARYDDVYLDRRHTVRRAVLDYCEEEQADGASSPFSTVDGACQADRVHLLDLSPYIENTTHWTRWLRTVVGVRDDQYQASDHSYVSGFRGYTSQGLLQPKGSVVLGPVLQTELYLSAGRGFHSDDVRGVFGTIPLEGVPTAAGRTPLLAAATGEEIGLRSTLTPGLSAQLAVFREDFKSELAYDADQGEDTPSAPSRREGVEVSAQYRPFRWIELNTDLAFSRARYRGDLAAFQLDGPYIANAPSFIGSFGVLLDGLGPWFGGLQWRKLGAYPISDGDAYPQDRGYSEFNVDAGYKVNSRLKLQVSIFNLLNTHADAASYYYSYRLTPTSPVGTGQTFHPLEPISARFSATAEF